MQIPEYQRYNNERDIALLDNSSISFLYELNSNGISVSPILSGFDLILIPVWVWKEVEDSALSVSFILSLKDSGYPIFIIDESRYTNLLECLDCILKRKKVKFSPEVLCHKQTKPHKTRAATHLHECSSSEKTLRFF